MSINRHITHAYHILRKGGQIVPTRKLYWELIAEGIHPKQLELVVHQGATLESLLRRSEDCLDRPRLSREQTIRELGQNTRNIHPTITTQLLTSI